MKLGGFIRRASRISFSFSLTDAASHSIICYARGQAQSRVKEFSLTANQIMSILIPVIAAFLVVGFFLHSRRLKKRTPPKVHGPHSPGPGYDAKEMARSKLNGMADGGIG